MTHSEFKKENLRIQRKNVDKAFANFGLQIFFFILLFCTFFYKGSFLNLFSFYWVSVPATFASIVMILRSRTDIKFHVGMYRYMKEENQWAEEGEYNSNQYNSVINGVD